MVVSEHIAWRLQSGFGCPAGFALGGGMGINSAVVGGTISLYQVGEWATAHVIRHNKQAKGVLGE